MNADMEPLHGVTDGLESASVVPYVVGIGASAGGLEALERFFENMPLEPGMAFVVVQHLSPDFKSVMDELLARKTSLPIHRAALQKAWPRNSASAAGPGVRGMVQGRGVTCQRRCGLQTTTRW